MAMQFGLAESVAHWGRYRPERVALLASGRPIAYRDLCQAAATVAAAIEKHAPEERRVAVLGSEKLHLLISILGALWAGKSAVILNPGLLKASLQTNIADTAPEALLFDIKAAPIAQLLPAQACLINTTDVLAQNLSSAQTATPRSQEPAAEWGVLFSSGTTGIPKGIERSHESMVTELVGWCLELGITSKTSFYVGRPLYYTGGLVLGLATLLVGGTLVVNDQSDENDFGESWLAYQASARSTRLHYAFFIPDQLRLFTELAKKQRPDAAAETILVMGAPITGAEKVAASKALGSQVVESWGNSESLGTITDPEDLLCRPDSIGRPFLTDRLLVVDDDCREVPAGVVGRIAGGEEAGFCRYSNRPTETERVKRNTLIVSEDLGYQDSAGYFFIRGREQECVVVRGQTIFLGEVERALISQGVALDCCVVAWGAEDSVQLGVMLVPAGAAQRADCNGELRKLLPHELSPPHVVLAERIPRLPSGKADRSAVERLFREAR